MKSEVPDLLQGGTFFWNTTARKHFFLKKEARTFVHFACARHQATLTYYKQKLFGSFSKKLLSFCCLPHFASPKNLGVPRVSANRRRRFASAVPVHIAHTQRSNPPQWHAAPPQAQCRQHKQASSADSPTHPSPDRTNHPPGGAVAARNCGHPAAPRQVPGGSNGPPPNPTCPWRPGPIARSAAVSPREHRPKQGGSYAPSQPGKWWCEYFPATRLG